MTLGERLKAALRRLGGKKPAPRAVPRPKAAPAPKGEVPQGAEKAAAAKGGKIPQGSSKTASGGGGKAPGTSTETAPKGGGPVPKASGEALPRGSEGALPEGSSRGAPAGRGRMPQAAPPPNRLPAAPKSSAEGSPARLRGEVAGSAGAAPRRGAVPTPPGQAGFSVTTEEFSLAGPPADRARELSELLRVQRRLLPNAGGFGEEVL